MSETSLTPEQLVFNGFKHSQGSVFIHLGIFRYVALTADIEPKIMEPEKCAELLWCDPHRLPEPHFDASRLAIACYLEGVFFTGISE